jgi:two-component system, LytTR family, response regulator LytT
MDQLKILIVEDELIVAEDIKNQLSKIGYDIAGIASSYSEAIKIIGNKMPDLVIIDIIIRGQKSGIDLGRYLRNETSIPFIYLSSHSDKNTLEQAKDTHPDAYLLKPYRVESLFASIEVAIGNASLNYIPPESNTSKDNLLVKDCLFIKKDHMFFKVRIKDILFIKGVGNYLEVYLNDGNKYLIRSTMGSFLQCLSQFTFFQCHKSYIINLDYIEIVSYTFVKIKENKIPLSKNKKDKLLSAMKSFS